MTLIGLFFWYAPSWGGTFYLLWTGIEVHPLIIYCIILSIFCSGAIIAVAYAIKLFKRGLRELNLKFAELKSYHQIYILTNQRWIQKDFRSLLYSRGTKFPHEAVSQTEDMVFINLNNIEKATISRIRSNYNIAFYFKPIFSLSRNPNFNIKFKFDDYQELKNILIDVIPIEILRD